MDTRNTRRGSDVYVADAIHYTIRTIPRSLLYARVRVCVCVCEEAASFASLQVLRVVFSQYFFLVRKKKFPS